MKWVEKDEYTKTLTSLVSTLPKSISERRWFLSKIVVLTTFCHIFLPSKLQFLPLRLSQNSLRKHKNPINNNSLILQVSLIEKACFIAAWKHS